MRFGNWRGLVAGALIVVALGAAVWIVAVPLAERAVGPQGRDLTRVEWLSAVSSARSDLLTGLSVGAGIVTAGFAVRRYFQDRDNQRLEADKHLVSQFDAAWTRLASEVPLVRANALRTLFRLMTDSERDRPLVLRSVCDLLRERTVRLAVGERLEPDITAAVDVLRERPRRADGDALDLTDVHLPGADLRDADLRGARFGTVSVLASAKMAGSDLRDAELTTADLTGADLRSALLDGATLDGATLTSAMLSDVSAAGANLVNASLRDADLTGADLRGADLRRAEFLGAKLDRTDLTGADLTDADLSGADLTATTGLTRETLAAAVTTTATAVPVQLRT